MTTYSQTSRSPFPGIMLVALMGAIAMAIAFIIVPQLGVVGGGSGATSNQVSVSLEAEIDLAIIPMARHSDPSHRPYESPAANLLVKQRIATVQSGQVQFAPPGQQDPDNRVVCKIIRVAGKVLRVMVNFIIDPSSGQAATAVFNPNNITNQWTTAFEQSRESFLVQDQLKKVLHTQPEASIQEGGCGDINLPPPPHLNAAP